MKHINQQAKKVFEKIISQMKDGSAKIDNSENTFMPVHINQINNNFYLLGHYYMQNGDSMADPEMCFWKGGDGNYYPCSFKMDGIGVYRESVIFENGKPVRLQVKRQLDDKNFANQWLKIIKLQQSL